MTRELLDRYRAGEFVAEVQLFERARERLLAITIRHPRMRSVQRHASPDDVVQEVFWRLLSSGALSRFEDRGRGSLEALVRTVLERTLVDVARRASTAKRGGDVVQSDLEVLGVASDGALASDTTTPTGNAKARELLEIAQRELTPREWEAWKAVEVDGFDSEEVAARLSSSSSSVRGLLLRARTKLARALDAERPGRDSRS